MRNDGASNKRVGVRNCYIGFVPELGNIRWIKALDVLFKNWVLSEREGAILALNMLLGCLKSSLWVFP